ncbi:MAG: enoyl-CoA hydratase/isomerase family protein [Qipengyuania pacifica]
MGKIGFAVDGHTAIITLDNPEKHNAVDAPMRDALAKAYERIEIDDDIRVAIIHGAGGKSFCAGGSIDGYLEKNAFGPDGTGVPAIPRPWPATKPYIGAINGYALGGGYALALSCDLRVAGTNARIGPSGLKRGAVQGAQTISRLTRLVGGSRAMQILLLSRELTGQEAAEFGLAELVEDDQVMNKAMEWANTIAEFSPWTVAQTKRLVLDAAHMSLKDAIAWESEIGAEAYRRPDAAEGFLAFKERRKPEFK